MEGALRCSLCGEVIGVYEPLVVLNEGELRVSSLAAEPALRDSGLVAMHRTCASEPPSPESVIG